MKLASVVGVVVFLVSAVSFAGERKVRGYVKRDGTYVQPHVRTTPNDTKFDNYSTKGNSNPYTGKQGTKNPYK